MGSAAARALARRGRRVALLERFQTGHNRGSSHGPSRIFRLSYHDPEYVRMAIAALDGWRELEMEHGRPLLTRTGGLDVGTMIPRHAESLRSAGAPFDLLSPQEVRARFAVSVAGEALFQPDAATVAAESAWRALVSGAAAAGTELRERTAVRSLTAGQDAVTVALEGPGRGLTAAAVVVTAGAWVRALLAGSGIEVDVRPTRETVSYFAVPEPDRAPAIVDWDAPAVYALWTDGVVKAGEHQAGPSVDPDAPEESDPRSVERVGDWMRRRFPGADGRALRSETCLYTNTDDGRFVLERHGRIVVGSPCSGHGFKFAPLIGERLADLAEEVI